METGKAGSPIIVFALLVEGASNISVEFHQEVGETKVSISREEMLKKTVADIIALTPTLHYTLKSK